MKEIVIILPNQLFENHPLLDKDRNIYIIESPRYFTDFLFHRQKLILHRASMRAYYDQLKKKKYSVTYIEYSKAKNTFNAISKNSTVHICDPVDTILEAALTKEAKSKNIDLILYDTPLFMTSTEWIKKNMHSKKHFRMHTFYVKQRKRLGILVSNNKPTGGSWSYDSQNREPMPSDIKIPKIPKIRDNPYVKEAKKYIHTHFKPNPGDTTNFIYPTTHEQAKKWLKNFLEKRLHLFGTYQDAMQEGESFLFHSVLSPVINTGLLTPEYVVNKTLAYAKKNKNITLNSLEGFIRQIIGWREFVRAVYILIGEKQRKQNFFSHTKKIKKMFYNGSTPLDPINDIIKKTIKTAYAHHIERLMMLGNSMLLMQIKPDDVYEWFMELFIDAYDWVMVPNIYGMSQYADGGLMTTKPYIASSNYVLKMSDYKKGEWCDIWNALFWVFVAQHARKLIKIPRMKFIMSTYKKKTKSQMEEYKKISAQYL